MIRYGIVAAVLLTGQSSFAQQVVVQQPVVQQPVVGVTSVNTTVSVPDRGRVFLGGVNSAQSGRSQSGPFRSGPTVGSSRQATSISATVYIHDLQAMDEALLNSGPSDSEGDRSSVRMSARRADAHELTPEAPVSPAGKIAKFEQLARKAVAAGKFGVAKLYWQMAARYGSKLAEARLADDSTRSTTMALPTATAAHFEKRSDR
jgi:hypothetical protein